MGYTATKYAVRGLTKSVALNLTVLFLASDDSSFSSGAEFVVDGGETAGLANR